MMRATDLAHLLVRRAVRDGDRVVDATVGNGHDTLFLAGLVGRSGRVFGFDVQEAALAAAARRLDGLPQVTLFHAGHETLAERLGAAPDRDGAPLAAAMFNLGYLPGGDRAVTTGAGTTIAGLEQALALLQPGGLATLVLYPGHPGGAGESAAVRSYAEGLGGEFAVSRYMRVNAARPAPELLAIERRG